MFREAKSAASGLEQCRIDKPDCILLDFNLPDSDGLEFLTQLRDEHGEDCPPVVMVTGQGNEAVAVNAMKLGAQDYLVKGMTADGLHYSIQNAIERASLRRQVLAQEREVARLLESQARLVEELSAADRRKNEFLAVLAHELRNPLGPIRNAAQLMALGGASVSPETLQARDVIDRQVNHMSRLIDDLLDVSRIVRAKVLLRKECIDLSSLTRATVQDHRGELADAGITATVDAPQSEVWIQGDPVRISQILSNILDNARKFTPRGGTIKVSLTTESDDDTATLSVVDSGEGLDAGMIEHMFEVFSQADRSLDRSRGGLGLGLAIVKGLAELHDGKVTAKSEGPGRGCEISVTLPLTAAPSRPVDSPVLHRASIETLRILIIEDNKDAADSLGSLLKALGHTVAIAYTGQTGLQAAGDFLPELVLCDIGLSHDMTGYAVAKQFRDNSVIASAYLIALTGYGRDEDQKRAFDAGFDLHLTKPVKLDVLRGLPALVSKI